MTVRRFDAAEIGRNVRRDERGFLMVPAYVTRVGVFAYKRADGTTVNELRPEDEVFRWDSLATLRNAPLTELHPKEFVTAENAGELEVGVVNAFSWSAGPFAQADLSIRRADTIAKVEAGELLEVSCGYTCDIETTSGTWNGQRYDQIQRNIKYNHVALGPKDWGRGGRDVSLRLDSGDALLDIQPTAPAAPAAQQGQPAPAPPSALGNQTTRPSAPAAQAQRSDSETAGRAPGKATKMAVIRIDGVDYEAPDQTAAVVGKLVTAHATLTKTSDEHRARADAAERSVKDLEGKLAKANDPKVRADEIKARVALERSAAVVLGSDERLDSLSDREVRVKALAKAMPDVKFDSESDDYVRASFDIAVKAAGGRNDGLQRTRETVTPTTPPGNGGERVDALDQARGVRGGAWFGSAKEGN